MPQAKKTQQTAFSLDMAVPAASSSDGDTVSLSSAATASLSSSTVRSSSGIPHYAGYTPAQDQLAAKRLSEGDTSQGFSAVITLTGADKALVKQATGYNIDSDPLGLHEPQGASMLSGRLALDRYSGALTGPLTMSYLEGLAKQTQGATVPLNVIMKAEKALDHIS